VTLLDALLLAVELLLTEEFVVLESAVPLAVALPVDRTHTTTLVCNPVTRRRQSTYARTSSTSGAVGLLAKSRSRHMHGQRLTQQVQCLESLSLLIEPERRLRVMSVPMLHAIIAHKLNRVMLYSRGRATMCTLNRELSVQIFVQMLLECGHVPRIILGYGVRCYGRR